MTTDTSETELDSLTVESLVSEAGRELRTNADFSREYAVDLPRLKGFLKAAQPEAA